jgi:hypothetical protein
LAFASVLVDIFVQLVCLFCFVLPGLGIVLSLVGRQQVRNRPISHRVTGRGGDFFSL